MHKLLVKQIDISVRYFRSGGREMKESPPTEDGLECLITTTQTSEIVLSVPTCTPFIFVPLYCFPAGRQTLLLKYTCPFIPLIHIPNESLYYSVEYAECYNALMLIILP